MWMRLDLEPRQHGAAVGPELGGTLGLRIALPCHYERTRPSKQRTFSPRIHKTRRLPQDTWPSHGFSAGVWGGLSTGQSTRPSESWEQPCWSNHPRSDNES